MQLLPFFHFQLVNKAFPNAVLGVILPEPWDPKGLTGNQSSASLKGDRVRSGQRLAEEPKCLTDTLRGPHPIFHLRNRGGDRGKLKKETGSDSEKRKEETLIEQQPGSWEAPCLCHLSSFAAVNITLTALRCVFL